MSQKFQLEVCVESLHSATVAMRAGADRIELNSALGLGGLTPTVGLLEQVKSKVSLPAICMVRPRPGDFHYSDTEFELMCLEAQALLDAGADGLAIGCLDAKGNVNPARVEQLRSICYEKELVFHRAFDCSNDIKKAAQTLIQLGVDRVLTSGGESTAIEGQEVVAMLQNSFGNRLQILPGSGIKSSNVAALLKSTGCDQVHGTFRAIEQTGSEFRSRINFNEPLDLEANQKFESCEEEIGRMLKVLGRC